MEYELLFRERQSCLLMIDEVGLEVPISRSVCSAIRQQSQAGIEFKLKDPFDKISDIFLASLDPKFIPPSEAQVNYVYVIAGALNLAVTQETVATKSSCHAFISKHVDKFRGQFAKSDVSASPLSKPQPKGKAGKSE